MDYGTLFWMKHLFTQHSTPNLEGSNVLQASITLGPEIFQRKMQELIEGLHGVDVIANNFEELGCGDMDEEGTRNRIKT